MDCKTAFCNLGVALEALALVSFVVWGAVTDVAGEPRPISFLERDPELSYPLLPNTVSSAEAAGLAIGVPLALFIIFVVYHRLRRALSWSSTLIVFLWLCLALAQALILTNAITNTIKFWLSRQRPNFFALCNYRGYRETISSGNFTGYNDLTVPGRMGDTVFCLASRSDVWEAQRSFPSGHSSISFCGMALSALFLRAALLLKSREHMSLPHAFAAAPLFLAVWIGITRVRDRWHHEDDVLGGSLIGVVCAVIAWKNFVVRKRDAELFSATPGETTLNGSTTYGSAIQNPGHIPRNDSTGNDHGASASGAASALNP
jgi:membrane-associated phospholipid phosphatase